MIKKQKINWKFYTLLHNNKQNNPQPKCVKRNEKEKNSIGIDMLKLS